MDTSLNPYVILGVTEETHLEEIKAHYESLKKRLSTNLNNEHSGTALQLKQVEEAFQLLSSGKYQSDVDTKRKIPFVVQLQTSKRTVEILDEAQVIYLLLDITPIKTSITEQKQRQSGLNLALVFDHSNSMKGIRLDRVKAAATEIINHLSEKDYLSVVGFNDRATVLVEATPVDNKKIIASRSRMARAKGGTEIFQGLKAGVEEVKKNLSPDRINHIILLTDGNTFGDQEACIELANQAAELGIGISALGLGSDWNDTFLDELAAITGGASAFIRSPNSVVAFMNSQVNKLSQIFMDRIQCSVVTENGVDVEMLFKIKPSPQPLSAEKGIIPLGGMQLGRPHSVLMQIQIPAHFPNGFQNVIRLVVTGDFIATQKRFTAVTELVLEAVSEADYEDPPDDILDALGKLTLYNMQEKANEALEAGNITEATQRLENLATRLLEMGHQDLANETKKEVDFIKNTHALSGEGRKTIKYQTRHLLESDTL